MARTETVIDWVGMVDDCVSTAVQLFEDPVALWARWPLKERRRFCLALYSGKLRLTAAGVIEPPSDAGLAGIIHTLATPESSMVRLTGSLSNLFKAIQEIRDLAA